jgi:DNA polymerase III subunit gamma/tau
VAARPGSKSRSRKASAAPADAEAPAPHEAALVAPASDTAADRPAEVASDVQDTRGNDAALTATTAPAQPTETPVQITRSAEPARHASSYTVVARRYRPQRFDDVLGQDHVVQSLRNAIRLNRIAQAYLFSGTRGVGKTSIARIFAKCLNCGSTKGPTEEPCQTCDICQSIALGQDVDVIEIDGASNNGVEQVRELRQNAALRPSRARFKIYYIDEVHMLSTGAFNALLKTLEEPPSHVKFLFATTEPNKIPITVLSRCQRYDFAGITPETIAGTLREICQRENVDAEPEALQIVARRAGGSLRDAQSLLDRLLASGAPLLSVEVVHGLLGTPSDERLLAMIEAMADHQPAAALRLLEDSASQGVQPAELLAGLIDFVRDAMVLALGAESTLLAISPRQRPVLKRIAEKWTIDLIIATLQIFSECRARMRGSSHGRLLVELALVRAARLDDLVSVSQLVERLAALESGTPGARKLESAVRKRAISIEPDLAPPPSPGAATVEPRAAAALEEVAIRPAASARDSSRENSPMPAGSLETKTPGPAPPSLARAGVESASAAAEAAPAANLPVAPSQDSLPALAATVEHAAPMDLESIRKLWPDLVKKVGFSLGFHLIQAEPLAVLEPNVLVIAAKPGYNSIADECGAPAALKKIESALERLTHRAASVRYERAHEGQEDPARAQAQNGRRGDVLSSDPMVQKVLELFEARTVQVDYNDSESGRPS